MKRRALLIGINKYQTLGKLSFARQDAEAFAETLCDHYGFSGHDINLMTCEVEGAGVAFSRYVELAISDLVKYKDLDLLVFGFWGHGFAPEAGKRYLCGLDTIVDDLERTAISMELIKAKLSQVGAENTLLVLDCCQNKPTGRSVEAQTLSRGEEAELSCLARDIQAARRKKAKLTVPTVAVLNSCREGQRAYEWEEREHGVFTAHLLDQMASGSSSIAQVASLIFDPVAHTSMNLHRREQTPFVVIEGKGDIQLIRTEAANKKTDAAYKNQRVVKQRFSGKPPKVSPVSPPKRNIKPPARQKDSAAWWAAFKDGEKGPFTEEQITRLINDGRITSSTELWKVGEPAWQQACEIKEWEEWKPETIEESRQKTASQTPKTGYGSLYVETRPSKAEIFLDSKPCGKSPVTLRQIPIGSRVLKAEKKNFITGEKEIEVKKEEITKIALELKPATGGVLIYSEPSGAEVFIDGKKADDNTPVSIKDIYAGKHQLKLSLSWYDTFKKTFKIIPDRTVEVDADLVLRKNFTDTLGIQFVYIEPGTFTMGSPSSESGRYDNEKQHKVTLTQGYYMQTTQVTQGQWKSVMGSNPSDFKGDNLPVENVSWNDAQKFIQKLNNRGDRIAYRLPTEAEWEYAARARKETYKYSGSNEIDEVAWFDDNSGGKTHPVGTKKPNSLGLYDMSGNVYEWCQDWYGDYPSGSVTDPAGPSSGSGRVGRGGGWSDRARYCRTANRSRSYPGYRDYSLGFRLAGH